MQNAGMRCAILCVLFIQIFVAPSFAATTTTFSNPQQTSHYAERLVALIAQAQHRIDIALYGLDDKRVYAALKRAAANGVEIRMLLDSAQEDRKQADNTASHLLESAGIDVRYINKTNHHKFILVDQREACTSSGNWTVSADQDFDEQAVWFDDEELVKRYQAEFSLLWHNSREFGRSFSFASIVEDSVTIQTSTTDLPGRHAYFTSSNFRTYMSDTHGPTFATVSGRQTVANALVSLIENAQQSIEIAVTHLRSRPIAEALLAKKATNPSMDIRVLLDAQEFISPEYNAQLINERNECLANATTDGKRNDCLDSGYYYSYALHTAGIAVRFKTNSYRWDYDTALQMHSKYAIFDDTTVASGSYNYSNNAEKNSAENLLVIDSHFASEAVSAFNENFDTAWNYGRLENFYHDLLTYLASGTRMIPVQFPIMSLSHDEYSFLKQQIVQLAPAVADPFLRKNLAAFSAIPSSVSLTSEAGQLKDVQTENWQLSFTYFNDMLASATLDTGDNLSIMESWGYNTNNQVSLYQGPQFNLNLEYDSNNMLSTLDAGQGAHRWESTALNNGRQIRYHSPTQPDHLVLMLDADDNLLSATDADQRTVQWQFDDFNNAVRLSTPERQTLLTEATSDTFQHTTSDGESVRFDYRDLANIRIENRGSIPADIRYKISNSANATTNLTVVINNLTVDSGVGKSASLDYQFDAYNRVIQAGENQIGRATYTGEIQTIRNNNLEELREHDQNGRLALQLVQIQGRELYSARYSYDGLGRIKTLNESILGESQSYEYRYQPNGMLSVVLVNDVALEQYTYDTQGNHFEREIAGYHQDYSYDDNNRLISRRWNLTDRTRLAEYDFNHSGQQTQVRYITEKDGARWVTRSRNYSYNTLGHLQKVTWASQQRRYHYDPYDRRIATYQNGNLERGLIYGLEDQPLAEVNENGRIINTYYYADSLTPISLRKGNRDYYIVADIRGSVRLVVNAIDGTVVQRIDYDAFGQILQNSNPGYTSFSFAGGLYDSTTGLTRFGARDYDAELARWTAEDPIGFASGDVNFYSYVANDPVNFADPTGLSKVGNSERALTKQQEKAIKSLENQIEKHRNKIEDFKSNPTVRPGMEKLPQELILQQQRRRVQHLENEIRTFLNNIQKIIRGEIDS